MPEKFDPYYKWLGIPPKDQPPHNYRLLGIELFETDRDVIDAAANRVMAYLKDLATGDEAAYSQRLLNEIAQARICLLNEAKKQAYDEQLRARLTAEQAAAAPAPPPPEPPPPVPPPGAARRLRSRGLAEAEPPAAVAPPAAEAPVDLESIVSGARDAATARPARRGKPVRPRPAKAGGAAKKNSWLLPSALAGVAGLALITGLLVWRYGGSKPSGTGPETNGGTGAGTPVLVLALAAPERKELTLFTIDGTAQKLPPRDEYELDAGEHTILLKRDGYADIREQRQLDSGDRWQVRPNGAR